MILTCPNCGTQYVVKDGAIPPEGRQVRCAACKHSWHQDPDDAGAPGGAPEPAAAGLGRMAEQPPAGQALGTADEDESIQEATLIDPRSGPDAEERAFQEAMIDGDAEQPGAEERAPPAPVAEAEQAEDVETTPLAADWNEPPTAESAPDVFSPFAENGDVETRRRSPVVTVLVIMVVIVALAALFWFFAPAPLKARLGLAATGTSSLALVTTHMDRQRLESGNELLTVTGRVINPTGKDQDVPPLQAQLKSRTGKVVYSWTIAPPARSLPAGASASFNSAEVNVPPGGDELTITLGDART
jgi:predicted Zn finger-like uncharacterized protein